MATRGEFVTAFLAGQGAPDTRENRVGVHAWAGSEFGWGDHPTARNNPLATTLHRPGSTDYNPAGVQDYPDFGEGVHASLDTLAEDHPGYGPIREALAAGTDAVQVAGAVHDSAWGSKPTEAHVEYADEHLETLDGLLVSGDPDDATGGPDTPDGPSDGTTGPHPGRYTMEDAGMYLLAVTDDGTPDGGKTFVHTGSGLQYMPDQSEVDHLVMQGVPMRHLGGTELAEIRAQLDRVYGVPAPEAEPVETVPSGFPPPAT